MSELLHVYSPSQVDSFDGCQRKWVFKSLQGMESPQGKGAALGEEVHRQLETYLKGGTIDYSRESGYIAAAALELLPKLDQQQWVKTERKIGFEYRGYKFTGRVDYQFAPPGEILTVGDHKTTSNMTYAKSSKDQETDVQATVYAWYALDQLQVPTVRLKWGYVQTRKPYITKPAEFVASPEHVKKQMDQIVTQRLVPMSALVQKFKRKKDLDIDVGIVHKVVQNVPPTPAHCEAYGGCPYKAHCPDVSPAILLKQGMMNLMGNTTPTSGSAGVQALLSKYKKTSADNPPPPPAPDPVNPPVEEQAPAPVAAAPAATEEKPKRKYTRKPKAAVPGEEAPVPVQQEEAAPETTKDVEDQPIDLVPTMQLFINCVPQGESDTAFNTARLLTEVRALVNAQLSVPDYRVEGYGKGKGYFMATAVEMAKSGKFGSSFVLDTMTDEGALLATPFSELAGRNIVRGLR